PRGAERSHAGRVVRAAGLVLGPAVDLLRLRLRLRAAEGPARVLLRDGRQPGQLPGQPLLGLRPSGKDPRQGLPDLLVVERGRALAALAPAGPLPAVPAWRPRATRLA